MYISFTYFVCKMGLNNNTIKFKAIILQGGSKVKKRWKWSGENIIWIKDFKWCHPPSRGSILKYRRLRCYIVITLNKWRSHHNNKNNAVIMIHTSPLMMPPLIHHVHTEVHIYHVQKIQLLCEKPNTKKRLWQVHIKTFEKLKIATAFEGAPPA